MPIVPHLEWAKDRRNSTAVRVTTATEPCQRSDSRGTVGSAIVTMMTTEPASHAALADAGELEHHRAALTRHCRRMLGSSAEADDAVQETMMRRGGPVTGSRTEAASARGSTTSPPTSASTRCAAGAATPSPSISGRGRRTRPHVSRRRGRRRARRTERRHPPRLCRRSPASPANPARRRDPARRLSLEGQRGRCAARHQRTGRQQRPAASAGDAPSRRCRGAGCRRRRAAAQPRPSRRRLRPERRDPARDVVARRRRRRRLNVGALARELPAIRQHLGGQ